MSKVNILDLRAEQSRTIKACSGKRKQDPCNTVEHIFPPVKGEGTGVSQGGPWTPTSNCEVAMYGGDYKNCSCRSICGNDCIYKNK